MATFKFRLIAAALIATTIAAVPAFAQRGPYHGGGYYYRGGGYYGGPRVGVGVTFGPYWGWGPGWYYPPYYYYPPAYYPPAVVTVPTAPPTYIEQGQPEPVPGTQSQAAAGVWYYCGDSKMYYPYVRECAGGWEAVPAQPPAGK